MEAFVEGGSWAIKKVAENLLETLDKVDGKMQQNVHKAGGEITTYIDLSPEDMDAFLPQKESEIMDMATQKAVKMKVLRGLQERMKKKETLITEAMDRQAAVKKAIGALKYVLPAAIATGAVFFPVLAGVGAASAVAWEIKKVLAGIKTIKEDIDRLTTSDYKSAMLLFKDILISLTNNVYPILADVKDVYKKANDGFHKLDDTKIEEKLELIKILMFCTVYTNCYDTENKTIIPFENVSENHKNIIREIFYERLQDMHNLSERNSLEYNSAKSFTLAGRQKYQKIVDAMDHVKKTSYSHILIKDTLYQANDFAVKVWSLKIYMVPEGENDALFSSVNIFKPTLASDDEEITIQASIYKDLGSTWFLKVHLPCKDDYADVSLICKFQRENEEVAFFLPFKIDSTSWKLNTSYLSNHEIISFYIFKPGQTVHVETEELGESLSPYGPQQVEIMKNGFESSRAILDEMSFSVAAVVGFMNLTSSTIQLSTPALTSGVPSVKTPWPKEVPPLAMINLVTHKKNLSLKGCIGATLLKLTPHLHVLLYWHVPFDQNWSKLVTKKQKTTQNRSQNCFGICCYSGSSLDYSGDIVAKIDNLPESPPNDDGKFHLHWANAGPICIDLTNNWKISVQMTEDRKSVVEVILYNDHPLQTIV
eukprot:GFUD01013829.1.p1 GENE.GFUD01013829.1~~GFUD01013829.1.p1  ORF type:complete len:667 (+),score=161.18 GFUD01013829.1:50-2002(+)